MKKFYKMSEIAYVPPTGGFDCRANIDLILRQIIYHFPNKNFEFSIKEFQSIWSVCKDEIMLSCLLSEKQKSLNKMLREGFDFRGIQIRLC